MIEEIFQLNSLSIVRCWSWISNKYYVNTSRYWSVERAYRINSLDYNRASSGGPYYRERITCDAEA